MTPDRVSAWATGIGIGFAVFIVTWLVLNRLLGLWLNEPAAPVTALVSAVLAGVFVSIERGRVLSRQVETVQAERQI